MATRPMTSPVGYDPLDEATLADPYPQLAALREQTPVAWHEGMECWLITRYEDCVRVLREHETFARDPRRLGIAVAEAHLSVQVLDPPQQAGVRSLFMTALHAQDLDALQDRLRQMIGERLDQVAALPVVEAMRELAQPVALVAIADLLGVTPPPLEEWAEISDTIMRSMDAGLNPELIEPGRRARAQLSDLVDSWFTTTGQPAGLLGHVRARTAGAGLEQAAYVRHTARVMFQGGYSTLTAALGNLLHTLADHPEILPALRERPGLVHGAVDELVRFDGPVQGTTRLATAEVTIGGIAVRRGEKVTVLFAAGNRDPAVFARPDRLVLDRTPNRHLGYGWGAHACLGTVMAQRVLAALVDTLLDTVILPRPAGSAPRRRTATMRTFARLPLSLQP
ncbi:cytochrome P450 [Streptomyces sp. NBC_01549]|uniref:cytochrome P450 n=1 Tax=Streptomyces sp. NBC_01549 TaxID=2975874 RepID=UPI00224CC1E2|nr:cytochrome P450 [Streptomyces sp. NBC_01549]MCX4598394.1 cytochrome P450 [Streptomyces sp. NBC_01549]